MIKVAFRLEPQEDVYAHLREWVEVMPWLEYLQTNCTNMSIESTYHPGPYQIEVTFNFDLPSKKETYYRLKYGDGL